MNLIRIVSSLLVTSIVVLNTKKVVLGGGRWRKRFLFGKGTIVPIIHVNEFFDSTCSS